MLAMYALYMLRYLRKCRVAVKKFRSVYHVIKDIDIKMELVI